MASDIRAHEPGTSPSGHFSGMPTRSRHARGAGAPGDTFRLAEVGRRGSSRRTRYGRAAAPSRASCGAGHAVADVGPRLQLLGRRCGTTGLPFGLLEQKAPVLAQQPNHRLIHRAAHRASRRRTRCGRLAAPINLRSDTNRFPKVTKGRRQPDQSAGGYWPIPGDRGAGGVSINTGVSHQAPRISGSAGSQLSPARRRPGSSSQNVLQALGCGHARRFALTYSRS